MLQGEKRYKAVGRKKKQLTREGAVPSKGPLAVRFKRRVEGDDAGKKKGKPVAGLLRMRGEACRLVTIPAEGGEQRE